MINLSFSTPFCGALGGRPGVHVNPWLTYWEAPLPAAQGRAAWQGSSGTPLCFVHLHSQQKWHVPWMGKALCCVLRFRRQVLRSEEPQREFKFTLPLSLIKWEMGVISRSRAGHTWDVQTLALLCTKNFSKNTRTQFSVLTETYIL